MNRAALIEIYTDNIGRLLDALRGADPGPSSEDISLLEYDCSHGSCTFERYLDVPSLLAPDAYGTLYLSLPLALLDFRVINLPFSSKETLEKVIPFELEPLIMDSLGEIVFDFLVIETSDEGQTVLVAFIRKGILRDILTALASRGIDPEVVTCVDLLSAARSNLPGVVSSLVLKSIPDPAARLEIAGKEMSSPSLNLRKGDFIYRKRIDGLSRRLKMTAVLAVILAVMLNASLALQSFLLSREAAAMAKQTRALYTGLFPQDRKIADEAYQMKAHLKDLQAKGDLLISADPLSCLLDLSAKRPGNVIYQEINISRGTITVKGETSSAGDVDKIKAGLSGVLTGISTADVKPLPDGKVSFAISGKRQQ